MNVSSNGSGVTIKTESEKSKEHKECLRKAHIREADVTRSALMDRVAVGCVGIICGAVTIGMGARMVNRGNDTLDRMEGAREKDISIGYVLEGVGLIVSLYSSFISACSAIDICKEIQRNVSTKKSN